MKYLSTVLFFTPLLLAQQYDLVLANGRVMDPESGLDAVRSVGINGGTTLLSYAASCGLNTTSA